MANGGILAERLQHKLLVVYFLMFVLPCTFLLVCIFQFGMTLGSTGASAPDLRIGLLIGMPALMLMSVGGFCVLQNSVRHLTAANLIVRAFLEETQLIDAPPPPTRDEAQCVAYYLSCLTEGLRGHLASLNRQTRELHAANAQLTDLALTDIDTGLYNRKHALRVLDTEFHRAAKHDAPLSVLLIRMDRPDQDDVSLDADPTLAKLAKLLDATTRRIDLVARYDSDRFLIILTETAIDGALIAAERVRQTVAASHFDDGAGKQIPVTVSLGVAACGETVADASGLIRFAEAALLIAEREARNTVRTAGAFAPGSLEDMRDLGVVVAKGPDTIDPSA